MGDSKSVTVRKNTKQAEQKPIPKGATILSSDTTTDVEKIGNGYLITKRTETRYKTSKEGYTDWFSETKKWFSKVDPLTINTKDKQLADAFEE